MKNVLGQVEKRLKSCLKHNKRIRYSKALALTFLLTGGFLSAEQAELAEDVNFVKVSENLNKRIKQLRLENKKKLKDSRLELERLEKEGDQVIKSPWDSYIFTTLGGFKDMEIRVKNRYRTGQNEKYNERSAGSLYRTKRNNRMDNRDTH